MKKKAYIQPSIKVYAVRPNTIIASSSYEIHSSGSTGEQNTKGDNSSFDDLWDQEDY